MIRAWALAAMMAATQVTPVTPVADTVWWETPGGQVLGRKTATNSSCSLTLYDGELTTHWFWQTDQPPYAAVTHSEWQFEHDEMLAIAVRIGNVWLDGGDGSPNIAAIGKDATAFFLLDDRVDELLQHADNITVVLKRDELSLNLKRAKLAALLPALRRCRSVYHL